jgi:hypothetical protein
MSVTNEPPAEPPAPAPEPPGSTSSPPPTGTEGGGSSEPPSPPPPTTPPAAEPPATDWRDRRIATLTRRLRDLQERSASTNGAPAPTPPVPQVPPPAEFDAAVNQRARELAAVNDFNRRCDEAAFTGRTTFGETEFNGRIDQLRKLVDNTDPVSVQAYNNLLMAALEAGDAPRLLHDLGADLNEAQRILTLNPTKMAVEMTRRAAKEPIVNSGAPKPITPVNTRGVSHEQISPDDPDRSDHLSTQEWMRRREAQLAARRQANGGR